MKHIITCLRSGVFKTFLGALLLLSLTGPRAFPQDIDPKTHTQLETIANYMSLNNEADRYLDKINFQRPYFISAAEWSTAPDVRKFTIAWKMAENKQQFLEALVKYISIDYNSIKSERKTSYHFTNNEVPTVKFKSPASLGELEKIPVPQNLKSEILTVGKYTSEGALGSMQSVFSNYMDLPENTIFDILSEAKNNNEAFEQALLKSKVPPPHEEKLSRMASDLQEYEAMRRNSELSKIANREPHKPFSFTDDKIKPIEPRTAGFPFIPSGSSGKKSMNINEVKQSFASNYKKYNKYLEVNYGKSSRTFGKMRRFGGGFGGVILGDSIKFKTTPKLLELKWRSINKEATDDFEKRGYLEFFFSDSSFKTYGPVLYEDVFAANAIINDTLYKYGNGVGMVSIVGSSDLIFHNNKSRRFGVTIHPAVSHMRLGWAFVIADALPTAKKSFSKSLGETSDDEIEKFYADSNVTWKITDKQIKINTIGSRINIDNIALTLFGFQYKDKKDTALTSKTFDKILPQLCTNVEEYKRVNEFAKVFAIFRWAKLVKSRITNIISYNSFVAQPLNVVLNSNDELEFYDFIKDRAAIKQEKEYYVDVLKKNANDSSAEYTSKIKKLLKWFDKISEKRAELWNYNPTNGASFFDNSKDYFQQEDTSGYDLMKEIGFIFVENDTLKKKEPNVGDSLLYFTKAYNSEIEKLRESRKKADSAFKRSDNIIQPIFNKYHIGTIDEFRFVIPFMTAIERRTIENHFKKVEEIESDLRMEAILSTFALTPFLKYVQKNNLISIAKLKNFIEAEKNILLSYEN